MANLDFTLVFNGKSFPVSKQQLCDLFEVHPCLFAEKVYQVQSLVTVEHFGDFVGYLKSKRLPDVTVVNAKDFYLLRQEFGLFDLASRCRQFTSDLQTVDSPLMSAWAELTAKRLCRSSQFESFTRDFPLCFADSVSSRFDRLERQVVQLERQIAKLDRYFDTGLSQCRSHCGELLTNISREFTDLESRLESRLSELKSACDHFRIDIDELSTVPHFFPLTAEDSLGGIISGLTQKHGGNVHDRGIVAITASDMEDDTRRNVADLTSDSFFRSRNEPGQWICWEFRDNLVRPTHYTIRACSGSRLESWLLEGSMNGEKWATIDQHRSNDHLKQPLI
jgi:hypothetical protein